MDLAVYGNAISDTIVTLDGSLSPGDSHNATISRRGGGVVNFCRALAGRKMTAVSHVGLDQEGREIVKELQNYGDCSVTVGSGPTSRATVVVDKVNNSRTGFVEWGACRQKHDWRPENVGWHHIMYLDRLRFDPSTIKSGVVSADICDSNDLRGCLHWLQFIDYLFVSEPRQPVLIYDLPVRRGIIVHEPGYAYVIVGGEKKVKRRD
jgi:hypothetical protein